MKMYGSRLVILSLITAVALLGGAPSWALAQCGGGSGSLHNQHMGSTGHMGSGGQMGMYGNQSTTPPEQYAAPGFQLEYLVLASNQFGDRKVNVYGFGHKQ